MNTQDELSELGDLEKEGSLKTSINLSNIYKVRIGGFGKDDNIKTYLCNVKVKELKEDISFYETLSKDKAWPVSQIIQREVDKIRVSNISKDYILGKGRVVTYFPPIVVALLPKAKDGKIDLRFEFETRNDNEIKGFIYNKSEFRNNEKIEKYFIDSVNLCLVKGLYLLEISKIFAFHLLCWEREKYYAIVIDGQHRLDALFKSAETETEVYNYTQDIVFLDLSSLIRKKQEEISPVELVRRIFIDINTNAQKVGVVRQILMDDKDLTSILVQSLVEAVNRDGSDKDVTEFIPSQIVDWYGESLKHTLPHLTGILALYQILDDYLIKDSLSSINDLRRPSKIKKWVRRLNDYFSVDKKIEDEGKFSDIKKLSTSLDDYLTRLDYSKDYLSSLDDNAKESELFTFDYQTLEVAKDSFDKLFLRPIVKFFKEFYPYKDTISIIEENNGFDNESQLSLALISSRNKIASNTKLKESIFSIRKIIEDKLYGDFSLIFTVLGQKAIFNLLFKKIFEQYENNFKEEDVLSIVDDFISLLNSILRKSTRIEDKLFGNKENLIVKNLPEHLQDLTLATSFWEGIIFEENKIIYNTQGIRSLSSLLEYLMICMGSEDSYQFDISYLKNRLKRILERTYNFEGDDILNQYVEDIVKSKENFINDYIKKLKEITL